MDHIIHRSRMYRIFFTRVWYIQRENAPLLICFIFIQTPLNLIEARVVNHIHGLEERVSYRFGTDAKIGGQKVRTWENIILWLPFDFFASGLEHIVF